jgi:Ca2+-binding EF-hand superfamily protein
MFKLYDANGDGMITRSDLLIVVNAVYQLSSLNVARPVEDVKERVDAIIELFESEAISLELFQEAGAKDPAILEALSIYEKMV